MRVITWWAPAAPRPARTSLRLPATLAPARARGLPRLPFPDASFDAALNLFTSLGYLGDEQDTLALREIGRVLRPGAAS